MKRWLKEFFQKENLVDMEDVLAFGGLGAACYGIYQVFPPAAWIVGGAVLFWLGVRRT